MRVLRKQRRRDVIVTDSFDPYRTWLGIEPATETLTLYRLLGLREFEDDAQRIIAAADRTMSRVRAQRPGTHAARWTQLLDELQAAKQCLTDPAKKTAYDASLGREAKRRRPELLDTGYATFEAVVDRRLAEAHQVPATMSVPLATPIADPMEPFYLGQPENEPAPAISPIVVAALPRRRRAPMAVAALTLVVLLVLATITYQYAMQGAGPVTIFGVRLELPALNREPIAQAPLPPAPIGQAPGRRAAAGANAPPSVVLSPGNESAVNSSADTSDLPEDMPNETAETPEAEITSEAETMLPVPNDSPDASEIPPMPDMAEAPPLPLEDPMPEAPSSAPTKPPMPVEVALPTTEELKQLGELLVQARAALAEMRFDDAKRSLAIASGLAQLPDHQEKVIRLQKLGGYQKQFHEAVQRAVANLDAAATFQLTNGDEVALVERYPNRISIHWKGQTISHSFDKLPIALGIPLAEQALDDSPESKVIKGAFQFLNRNATPEHIEEVRQWWTEALEEGAPIEDLIPVLDDQYDFVYSAPE